MDSFAVYSTALWGVWLILATWLVQWFVASGSKAKQPGAVPGKIDENLSHSSFVFRAHRTFMNSLENLPAMIGTAFLAMLVGANPGWVGGLVWLFAICRIVHMVLYYKIATEKNPSPRSWFFILGLMANVALLAVCALALAR